MVIPTRTYTYEVHANDGQTFQISEISEPQISKSAASAYRHQSICKLISHLNQSSLQRRYKGAITTGVRRAVYSLQVASRCRCVLSHISGSTRHTTPARVGAKQIFCKVGWKEDILPYQVPLQYRIGRQNKRQAGRQRGSRDNKKEDGVSSIARKILP